MWPKEEYMATKKELSERAKRSWETRRANERSERARRAARTRKLRERALKAWETRRSNG
jgi:hypothetical protein